MKKEFVMRGKTAKGVTETLNFSGYKPGYAYRLTEFNLFPSVTHPTDAQLCAVITAGKTALDPQNPDFSIEGCIGNAVYENDANDAYPGIESVVINDTFLITQDLLLTVFNTESHAINWQCRFVATKLNNGEEALANYNQFTISND